MKTLRFSIGPNLLGDCTRSGDDKILDLDIHSLRLQTWGRIAEWEQKGKYVLITFHLANDSDYESFRAAMRQLGISV